MKVTNEYQTLEVAANTLLDKLRFSELSYDAMRPLCNHPPIRRALNETVEERKKVVSQLEWEMSLLHIDVNQDCACTPPSKLLNWERDPNEEFCLKSFDQNIVREIDLMLISFHLPGRITSLLSSFSQKLETHLDQIEVVLS